ncbi:MAG: hypothetical protein CMJ49_01460 [Planctomycetaceae bacterium]|nr:hypothetical protein [Planctomycetaceae bacterium]
MSGHDNLTVRVAGALNDPMTRIVHDGIVSIGDAEHPDPIECQHFCCGQDYGGDYPPRFTITAPLLMRDDWQTANTKVTLLLSVNQLHDTDMNSHLGSTFDFPFVLHNSNFVQASEARAGAPNAQ